MNDQTDMENSGQNDLIEENIDIFDIFPKNPLDQNINKIELLSIALDKRKSKTLFQKLRKSYGLTDNKTDNTRFNLLGSIFSGHFKKNLGEVN